jgi:hypothetical protein
MTSSATLHKKTLNALKLKFKGKKDCHYWRCNGKDVATTTSWNQGMQKCQVHSLNWSMQDAFLEAFVKKMDGQFSNSKMNIQCPLWHCCKHCGSSKGMYYPKKLMWYIFKAKKWNKVNWVVIVFKNLAKEAKKKSQQEVSYKVHPYIWLQSQLG